MFKKTIEAIIQDGLRNLERFKGEAADTAEKARAEIQRCSSEIQGLVALAKEVPEKVFDRYSRVMIGEGEIHDGAPISWLELRAGMSSIQIRGLLGSDKFEPGKYRMIVLVEKVD